MLFDATDKSKCQNLLQRLGKPAYLSEADWHCELMVDIFAELGDDFCIRVRCEDLALLCLQQRGGVRIACNLMLAISTASFDAHQEVLECLEVGQDPIADNDEFVAGIRDVGVSVSGGGRSMCGPARVCYPRMAVKDGLQALLRLAQLAERKLDQRADFPV